MPIHLEIVTAERVVLSDDVDQVNVPTKDGPGGHSAAPRAAADDP